MKILGDPAPGQANLTGFKLQVDATTGQMTIVASDAPAEATRAAFKGRVDTSRGTMTLDGNPALANGKITSTVQFADGSRGTITVDGNQTPANGKINATVTYADGRVGTIKVNARDFGANSYIDWLARPRTSTITVTTHYVGSYGAADVRAAHGGAIGGIVHPMRDGGLVGMAGGGGVSLTPMRGGIAQVVKPNTWRVIGDRVRDDEAFIPINTSARSRQILGQTAGRMGYDLVRGITDRGFGPGSRAGAGAGMATVAPAAVRSPTMPALRLGEVVAALQQLRADLRSQYAPPGDGVTGPIVGALARIERRLGEAGPAAKAGGARWQSAMGAIGGAV
jgi:hypothetical protein